jgi:hypothetical protein
MSIVDGWRSGVFVVWRLAVNLPDGSFDAAGCNEMFGLLRSWGSEERRESYERYV